jgi:hypothetical protein
MKLTIGIALLLGSSVAYADTLDMGKLNCRVFALAHIQGSSEYDRLVSDWLVEQFIALGDQKAQLLMANMSSETLDSLGVIRMRARRATTSGHTWMYALDRERSGMHSDAEPSTKHRFAPANARPWRAGLGRERSRIAQRSGRTS